MNKLFSVTSPQIKKTFGMIPTGVTGGAQKALESVSSNFTGIGSALAEGGVSEELAEVAISKLFDAQLAVNAAIQHGWNNGKGY